ncbi:MAG: hypothetical protein EB006_14265 [Betaproteobacteria bacterium]|nr:hypothetical protein [Betaproteobacteria bacterium]
MGPKYQIDFCLRNRFPASSLFALFEAAAQPLATNAEPFEQGQTLGRVLISQNLGWRQEGNLIATIDRLQSCQQGDDGFATAHIALQQSMHWNRP